MKQPKHYKSKNESSLSRIWVDVGILIIILFVEVSVDIKQRANISDELSKLISINPISALIVFILLHIIFLIIRSFIYNKRKQNIMEHGNVMEGIITDTIHIKVLSRTPGATYNYKYHVQLSDGRTVNTEVYYEDFVKNDDISSCTVYEYNNHYYFTDFR